MIARRIPSIAAGLTLAALAAPGLDAQKAAVEGAGAPETVEQPEESDLSGYSFVSDLIDRQVVNSLGEEIGDISRLIMRDVRVTHAIVSIGGFAGLGGSEVVVPFDVLTVDGDRVVMKTLASADQIGELTVFDAGKFGLSP